MKILIAEDEILERKAMKKFIQDNFTTMEVVGEAENGRRAIELAIEKHPDIIFMDIKMPGINGLEAIEQIHEKLPHIKFILVSAYDTFAYAKQAMQFGIKDYILKPEKKEEIVKALFRLQEEIAEEEELRAEKYRSKQLLEERFIRGLMKQPFQDKLLELQQQLFPRMVCSYFLVVGGNQLYTLTEIKEHLRTYASHDFLLYEKDEIIVILVIANEVETKANQLVLARKLSLEFNEELYIGIGKIEETVEKLSTSYRKAYAAYFQHITNGKSNYGFLQEKEKHYGEVEISQIILAIEKGNHELAIEKYKESEEIDGIWKEKLYIKIQTLFSKRNIIASDSTISSVQSNEDWVNYITVCCLKMKEYWHSKHSMSQAKAYIEANYAEGISLEDVADFVNLSPNYFSNLFKEEFGETFIEFLTKTRMECAKLLIEKNTYSLKEICFKVGYKDPNYFSRVFKKYFDVSPKHFQKRIFEK